jgi:hypothetical protein
MKRTSKRTGRVVSTYLGAAAGLAAVSYGACVAWSWARYGRANRGTAEDTDPLLDRFIPEYDVAERHHVRVKAPAAVTLASAAQVSLAQSAIVRAIFRTRELVMGSQTTRSTAAPQGLLAQVKSLGWGVLAETPGREIVMGAVTRPWEADVVFRALAPDEFASFAEPEYVKIVWTLRADPAGPAESVFRTETRVIATDAAARSRFRRYWAFVSPGIRLIRWLILGPVKAEAEYRARSADYPTPVSHATSL